MLVATRALVAPGAYGPRGFEPGVAVPLGAEEADGPALVTAARRQIGAGADVVKLYADYRWGAGEPSRPTFTQAEMAAAVEAAQRRAQGRRPCRHGGRMRRAVLAGVDTIEHGDEGTAEVFALMKQHGTGYCPTLAATDAIARYRGWNGRSRPRPWCRKRAPPSPVPARRASRSAWAAMSASSPTATTRARRN
jgi:hypothetical protein